MSRSCLICGVEISARNLTDRCKNHIHAPWPPRPANTCLDCGVQIDPYAKRCVEHAREAAKPKMSEAGLRFNAKRMAWLPEDRREEYKRFRKNYTAAIAKEIVLANMRDEQHDIDQVQKRRHRRVHG